MYINKIDELVDKIIDDFYNNIILKDKEINKILDENNFIKYQKELNDIMSTYIKNVNLDDIKTMINNKDNILRITEIIKRYIAYYLFMTIGVSYKGKYETFINNIVEFSKNQHEFNYKIDNFFNSENNANVIKMYTLSKNIINMIDAEPGRLSVLILKPEYKEAIELLNDFGQEYVNENFKLKNIKDRNHNIIKTLILFNLYKQNEKKDVYKMLEMAEKDEGEYIFIDVLLPKTQYIDFSVVENILSSKRRTEGLAHEIYNFIINAESGINYNELTIDDKILSLINKKIIVPISDDFLLYHKDTEKYEKTQIGQLKKKKEDTKIRYIVSKIENVSEYYSEQKDPKNKQNIFKLFYTPLTNRKAILINNNEEIKIINKLLNLGRRSIENNEYYNDLLAYRQYPYINFKDFEKYGFNLHVNKTYDVVRSVSFTSAQNKSSALQIRVGSKDHNLNIVGIAVVNEAKSPLQCLYVKNTTNVKTVDPKKTNGYELMLNIIQKKIMMNEKFKTALYWLFDLEQDKITTETYEQVNKMTNQEQIKIILGQFYDEVIRIIYDTIISQIDKNERLPIYSLRRIVKKIEKQYLKLGTESDYFQKLQEKIFYDKYEQSVNKYDENEDKIHGLFGDVFKLPNAPAKKKDLMYVINLDYNNLGYTAPKLTSQNDVEQITNETDFTDLPNTSSIIGSVCQHNISWDNVSILRKRNPNQYTEMLHEFIQNYVIENNDGEYICKSCGFQLNIDKFIIDGSFDNDTQKFMPFSVPMEVPLEDIPEYEKYNIVIRNLEKIIEKIASIANIQYFMGSNTSIKWRKKSIIKDVIDIVVLNNKILYKNFRERNESASKKYNINRDLSNLFVFELENDIFVFSSKGKDYYKNIKQNNVLTYLVISIILELNENHIINIKGDKTSNYYLFEKYGFSLFDNLMIMKNNKGDIEPINKYPVLCYIIYMIACVATKYNMWFYEQEDSTPSSKAKMFVTVVKSIIHSILDVLNSILEIRSESEANIKNRIYDIMATRFYIKLKSIYIDKKILTRIRDIELDKAKPKTFGTIKDTNKYPPIRLSGTFDYMPFDIATYQKCVSAKYFVKIYPNPNVIYKKYYNICNMTNCPSGEFHKWAANEKTMKCKICKNTIDTIKYKKSESEQIEENYKYVKLQKIALKYCQNGLLHNFMSDSKKNCNTCNVCKIEENHTFSQKELELLNDNLQIYKTKLLNDENAELVNYASSYLKKIEKYQEYVKKIETEYTTKGIAENNKFYFLKGFFDNIQNTIGKDTPLTYISAFETTPAQTQTSSVQNSKNTIYIYNNIYIIDHDHLGYPLDKPIVITDHDNKINYKTNNPIFNTNVLYYTNYVSGKIDIYYDATTFMLIGYKENNKDYVIDKKPNCKIKINYSLFNRLKLLGYKNKYINISADGPQIKKDALDTRVQEVNTNPDIDNEKNAVFIIQEANRERISNLKKFIYDMQRVINRIKYNYSTVNTDEYDREYEKPASTLINRYIKKLSLMKIEENNNKIFKNWKILKNNVYTAQNAAATFADNKDKFVSVDDVVQHDSKGNLILYYITRELTKLLEFNQNKVVKTNIIYFIVDLINYAFDMFNIDDISMNFDIKRFNYLLKSGSYLHDIEQKGYGIDDFSTGFYGEYKDPDDVESDEQKEENDDAREEADALDVEDNEINFEAEYDRLYTDYLPSGPYD